MTKVSVIVPSFQHGRFLAACLGSVLEQTYRDWEALVIDDGSDDESVEVAKGFAGRDTRVRVLVNESNLGTYGTQARGLSDSSGDLVAVLNSDDTWHPDKLRRQVELMDRRPDLPYCYVLGRKSDATGSVDETEDVHGDWPTDEVQDLLPRLLEENRVLASGVMFRKSDLLFDPALRYSGDWVALLRLAKDSPVGCVPDHLTYWRVHGENSHLQSAAQSLEEVRVRNAVLHAGHAWHREGRDRASVRNGLGLCARHLSALAVFFGDMVQARTAAMTDLNYSGLSSAAVRRAACCFLPLKSARARLWPGVKDFGPVTNLIELEPLDILDGRTS